MKYKRYVATVATAAVLSAAMAGAVSAGAPTYEGVLACDSSTLGGVRDLTSDADQLWTKKQIAAWKRDNSGTIEGNYCDRGPLFVYDPYA